MPSGPIYGIDQMFADPHVAQLGVVQDVTTKAGKALRMPAQPIGLSRTPSKLAGPPPGIGEHTDEVLGEFGFSADEIASLRESNAI